MTLYEFYHLRRASQLKDADEEYKLHRQAYYYQMVQATEDDPHGEEPSQNKKPKPQRAVYQSLSDFYDYEGIVKSIQNDEEYVPKEAKRREEAKKKAAWDDEVLDMLEKFNNKT